MKNLLLCAASVLWCTTSFAADVVDVGGKSELEQGFVSMFDGQTLAGWTCAPAKHKADWFAEDGVLVGESEERGSYLAWTKGGELRNFEVRFSYRIKSDEANTGLQVRSKLHPNDWPYPLKGYQADIGHVGIGAKVLGGWDFHGEPRGDILVRRGQSVTIKADGSKKHIPIYGAVTKKDIRKQDWNDVRVMANGDAMFFYINGKIASAVYDQEVEKRVDEGYLGLQLHQGDGMRIEFRNLRIKQLP